MLCCARVLSYHALFLILLGCCIPCAPHRTCVYLMRHSVYPRLFLKAVSSASFSRHIYSFHYLCCCLPFLHLRALNLTRSPSVSTQPPPPHPLKVLRVLLSHGLDSLVPDANCWTPFCYALWKENTPCVLELLKVSDENSLKQFGVRH